MFAGLVATASSRSSRHGSATSGTASPTISEDGEEREEDVGAAHLDDTYAAPNAPAAYASPFRTQASSPRTDGRRPPPSEDFQTPYSVGGYPTPSTGFRPGRHHPFASPSAYSPSQRRSWGSPSADREGGAMYADEGEGLEDVAEEVERGDAFVVPAAHSAPHSPSTAKTTLEALADERTSASSSPVSEEEDVPPPEDPPQPLPQSPLHRTPHLSEESGGVDDDVDDVPVAPRRIAVVSQPLVASTRRLASLEQPPQLHAARFSADSLSPITPPFAAVPLSPLTPPSEEGKTSPVRNRRSATREGGRGSMPDGSGTSPGSSSPASSSSSFSSPSHRAEMPCAPPHDSPPDSAMKRPPGTVMVEERGWETAVTVVPAAGALVHSGALAFEVHYREEEHRVRVQTQETQERRCLFRAHRAVLTVYRMWAAEGVTASHISSSSSSSNNSGEAYIAAAAAAAADVEEEEGEALFHLHRLTERADTGMVVATVERSASAASTAADRVQSFLQTSIESARERRSGSAKSAAEGCTAACAAACAAPPPPRPLAVAHHALTPTIAYSEVQWEEQRHARHASVLPTPPLSASAVTATTAAAAAASIVTSPAPSRVLDYSSLLAGDTHGTGDVSFAQRSGRWTPRVPQPPQPHPQPFQSSSSSRLFSPWRWGSPGQRSPPTSGGGGAAGGTWAAQERRPSPLFGVGGGGEDPHRANGSVPLSVSPLIPHIRLSSPLTAASEQRVRGVGDGAWRGARTTKADTTRQSPGSLLSDTYLSLTGYHTDAAATWRAGREKGDHASPTNVRRSPALVRSPRAAADEAAAAAAATSAQQQRREPTPPWNTSPNLRSTAAAGRASSVGREGQENESARAPSPPRSLGFVPNNAFHQRQRAATFTSPFAAPSEAGTPYAQERAAPPAHPAAPPSWQQNDAQRQHERLSGYVQYKRYFDAAYSDQGVPEGVSHTHRTTAPSPAPLSFAHRTTRHRNAAAEVPHGVSRSHTTSTLRFADRDGDATSHAARDVRRVYGASRRTWGAAEAMPRYAVPHPTTQHSTAATARRLGHPPPSTWLTTTRDGDGGSAYVDVYTARLTRLGTLEQLCRAELQRRWMEDQNVLLHRFVTEGTATLRRGRVGGIRTAAPQSHQQLRRRAPAQEGVLEDACAWTFIPNEME